jgi:hypothetical protein
MFSIASRNKAVSKELTSGGKSNVSKTFGIALLHSDYQKCRPELEEEKAFDTIDTYNNFDVEATSTAAITSVVSDSPRMSN